MLFFINRILVSILLETKTNCLNNLVILYLFYDIFIPNKYQNFIFHSFIKYMLSILVLNFKYYVTLKFNYFNSIYKQSILLKFEKK